MTYKPMFRATTVVLALAGASVATDALAVCDQSGSSTPDIDYWDAHGGYWEAYVMWHYKAYHTYSGEWPGRGFDAADVLAFEYAKHWSAAHLLSYNIHPVESGFFIQPFHDGELDYQEVGRGRESDEWHDNFLHRATDDTTNFGTWQWFPFDENEVETSCLLYNRTSPNGTPSRRASDYVHEGWHAWKDEHDIENPEDSGGHFANGPAGLCTAKTCDYFYLHPKSGFSPGSLWTSDVDNHSHYHSVYQIQMEMFCDVADSSRSSVPMSVRLASQAEGNAIRNRFINGSPIACGHPTPMAVVYPGGACVGTGGSCGPSSECCSSCCKSGSCVGAGACIH